MRKMSRDNDPRWIWHLRSSDCAGKGMSSGRWRRSRDARRARLATLYHPGRDGGQLKPRSLLRDIVRMWLAIVIFDVEFGLFALPWIFSVFFPPLSCRRVTQRAAGWFGCHDGGNQWCPGWRDESYRWSFSLMVRKNLGQTKLPPSPRLWRENHLPLTPHSSTS